MENTRNVLDFFQKIVKEEPDVSAAVAAIRTLMNILENFGDGETLRGLSEELRKATEEMKKAECSITSVQSGCELFQRFITLTSLEQSNFKDCKEIMKKRGEIFLRKLQEARPKIARLGAPFILDGHKILTHSKSRVVLQTLVEAAVISKKRFHVFITESHPDLSGVAMRDELLKHNIGSTLILDSAMGYVMESVDLVLVGAEGVVESGGIINKIGTYTMALCAKEMHKPFYVLAESFKFVRLYPLNQRDLPQELKFSSTIIESNHSNLLDQHPQVDYTPPGYLTLLFTDLGILTPSAVSDELIKLYL
ncbi:translation initiation factor eIF-2B subunit alpha-like [Daphnia pulicaria]|uniref:translation initiation factor eIF-2B subunit alpha-like n=1 Tax=Daphnia pulicaria TaxID=35523 RepID=UPI001EEA76E0|nr:translation initiation factor eIF-2B subunit alpha-like [Daphnia pulicaria]